MAELWKNASRVSKQHAARADPPPVQMNDTIIFPYCKPNICSGIDKEDGSTTLATTMKEEKGNLIPRGSIVDLSPLIDQSTWPRPINPTLFLVHRLLLANLICVCGTFKLSPSLKTLDSDTGSLSMFGGHKKGFPMGSSLVSWNIRCLRGTIFPRYRYCFIRPRHGISNPTRCGRLTIAFRPRFS